MERATNSSLILYTTEDGLTKIEATFDRDTVWLSIDQMADLFQRNKSTISRHIGNIYKEGELDKLQLLQNLQQFRWKANGRWNGRLNTTIWTLSYRLGIV